MTRSRSRRSLLILLVALLPALAAAPALSQKLCQDLLLVTDGATQFNPATGVYEGDLIFALGPRTYTFRTQTLLLGIESADADGVLTSRTTHQFDLAENGIQLVTFDRATLVPTATLGVYDFTSHLTVRTGTRYDCGEILAKGSINLATGTLTLPALVPDGAGGTLPGTVGRACRCR
ncbi:MAG TPA: hypothetical protein VMV46_17390 [Thermoanaerobaculia bacterium]|nr:hypothetical protein [Thermoanaerobaculia bacterium]